MCAGNIAERFASTTPRSVSGARNVARSLATQTSLTIAMIRPPPWQMPFTAVTTGARLLRIARNGRRSMPITPRRSWLPSS